MYHIPVLLHESVDGLNIHPSGTYVDVTFGGGGHSREILRRLGDDGHLYSFDQDADAEGNIPEGDERFTFVRSNFRFDAPLDMRMNGRAGMTAADIVNRYDEERLANVLYLYGELKNSRKLAAAMVKARALKAVETIDDLLQIVKPFMPREREKKDLARVFQALRIEVNHEMDALHEMLEAALKVLRPGGRLVVLTYHSLEDRMVKNFVRSGRMDGKVEQDFFGRKLTPWRAVNNKVIVPDEEEQRTNPRSRSAKLRIAEKL